MGAANQSPSSIRVVTNHFPITEGHSNVNLQENRKVLGQNTLGCGSSMGFPKPLDYRIPHFQRIPAGLQLLSEPYQVEFDGRSAICGSTELQGHAFRQRLAWADLVGNSDLHCYQCVGIHSFFPVACHFAQFQGTLQRAVPVLLLCADHHAVRSHGGMSGPDVQSTTGHH